MRKAATHNAHVAGLFIAQGHHDAFIRCLNLTYRERRQCFVDAFARHLPGFRFSPSAGGGGLPRGCRGRPAWIRSCWRRIVSAAAC
jgi:GntR family transcriptional regulator/MocR family aminotransferase